MLFGYQVLSWPEEQPLGYFSPAFLELQAWAQPWGDLEE